MPTPHKLINPPGLAPPKGYSHVVVPAAGRTVYLGGMAPQGPDDSIVGETFPEQFEVAAKNLVTALRAAGAEPEHLVWMQLFVKDAEEYRSSLKELGEVYRKHLGRHYPAMALFEVGGFYHREARLEIMALAVVPE